MKKLNYILPIIPLLFMGCSEETIDPGITASVKIEVVGTPDSNSVKILFTPDERTATFDYAIGSEMDYALFESGIMEGVTTVEGNEPCEVEFTGLKSTTIYSIYAKAYTKNGQSAGTNIYKVSTRDTRFTAEMAYVSDISAGFHMNFSSNGEYSSCRYYLGKAGEGDLFLAGEGEYYGESASDVVDYISMDYFDLEPETEYVFYAVGIDRAGVNSELFEIPFTTYASDACPNVTVETDIDLFQGTYTITPNDKVGKIIAGVQLYGVYEQVLSGNFNNDMVHLLETWLPSNINNTVSSENGQPLTMSLTTYELNPEDLIDFYIAIYDKDGNIAGLKKIFCETHAFDETLALPDKIDIKVENITTAGAVYTFTPGENVWAYFYDTVDADWYDELKETSDWNEYYLANEFYTNHVEYWLVTKSNFQYGNDPVTWAETTGQANYRYYASAVSMNENGPVEGGWGETVMYEYTTLAE